MARRLDPIVIDYLTRTPWRIVLRDQVQAVNAQLAGNVSAVAERLACTRRTVYRRLASSAR